MPVYGFSLIRFFPREDVYDSAIIRANTCHRNPYASIFYAVYVTLQKMEFSIKDFFSKYDQIRRKLRIWSHFLKKSLLENFIFCAVWQLIILSKIICISAVTLILLSYNAWCPQNSQTRVKNLAANAARSCNVYLTILRTLGIKMLLKN